MFKKLAVQFTKVIWNAEFRLMFVMFLQSNTKIIIAHIGRKVIAYNAFNAFVSFMINNVGF